MISKLLNRSRQQSRQREAEAKAKEADVAAGSNKADGEVKREKVDAEDQVITNPGETSNPEKEGSQRKQSGD